MSDIHAPFLNREELEAFHEEGYVRLGRAVPVAQIKALCQRIDDIMLGKVVYPDMLMQLCPSAGEGERARQSREFKGSSLKYRKIQDLERDPLFRAYIQQPLFRDLTAQIIGAAHKAARFEFRFQIIPHQCKSVSNFLIPKSRRFGTADPTG